MRQSILFLSVFAVLVTGCSSGGDKLRTMASAKEQAHLDAHIHRIFAKVQIENEAQLDADRQRVRDIHQIAYWAEAYKEKIGDYPLVDPDTPHIINVIIGGDITGVSNPENYVTAEEFEIELQVVLGDDVVLPRDPMPDGPGRTYVYSLSGKSYATAAMLYHPVGWSEGIQEHQWQYRLGAYENNTLPVLQTAKLLDGGYTDSRTARKR